MFEMYDQIDDQAVIKVIGVGGGGGNALEHMLNSGIEGVEFINANTDAQVLTRSKANIKIQLGLELTKGLGAGANPEIGRQAAMEDRDRISDALKDTDMVFITAGMGGGTGTGAAPVIAQIAKEMGILTVAVVTKPFPFEGRKRVMLAEQGICELAQYVDSLITIPNEKILTVLGKQAKFTDAFAKANDVLYNAVQGISELITQPGFINVDFADVKTVMSEMGVAMMGSAVAKGPDRATEATRGAISSPFLEDINMSGAKGILVNVTASMDMEIGEFDEVGQIIKEFTSEDATVIMGTAFDEAMKDELRVTIVVTGLANPGKMQKAPERKDFRDVNKERVVRKSPPVLNVEVEKDDERRKFVNSAVEEKPARRMSRAEFVGSAAIARSTDDWDELDIPAFLRNQAD